MNSFANKEGRPAVNGTALEASTEAVSESLPAGTIGGTGSAAQTYAERLGDERRSESPWNLLLDRKLAHRLTAEEHRYVDGIARLTLGFQGREFERLGDKLVRETTGLHGRSLDTVRASVAEKGLILFERGKRGRGSRSLYVLVLDLEKTGDDRPFPHDLEKTGDGRAFSGRKPGEKTGEKTGPHRGRTKEVGTPLGVPTDEETNRVDGDTIAAVRRSGSIDHHTTEGEDDMKPPKREVEAIEQAISLVARFGITREDVEALHAKATRKHSFFPWAHVLGAARELDRRFRPGREQYARNAQADFEAEALRP